MDAFRKAFGQAAQASGRAPGRVNLLGEHTDYNLGLVMPLAIPRHVCVQVARSPDSRHRFHSVQLRQDVEYEDGQQAPGGFALYLQGCIEALRGNGHAVPAVCVHVDSDVPIGAGLSSSAALEVAMLRALRELLGLAIDDEAIARLAHMAETRYAGVNCGILDQMACSLADTDRMLFLDTQSMQRRLVPLPAGSAVLIIDSGESRSLAGSGYNQRRAECEEAARLLGLASLRELQRVPPEGSLPPNLLRRARHVFTENARVSAAAAGVDARHFGELMNESHASLSTDYEVSTPALDALAGALQSDPDVYGAKLTGAGFGGACVALARSGRTREAAERVMAAFAPAHPRAAVLITG